MSNEDERLSPAESALADMDLCIHQIAAPGWETGPDGKYCAEPKWAGLKEHDLDDPDLSFCLPHIVQNRDNHDLPELRGLPLPPDAHEITMRAAGYTKQEIAEAGGDGR